MKHDLVIYQAGQVYAKTSVTTNDRGENWADYTGDPRTGKENDRAEDYLSKLNRERDPQTPEYRIIPQSEAMPQIEAAAEAKFVTPWKEITQERWDEMLEVLPPQKWKTVRGVEIFQMSERTFGNITGHFARVGDRCFERECRMTVAYETLADEVLQFCRENKASAAEGENEGVKV